MNTQVPFLLPFTPETSVVVTWKWGWGKLGISRWRPPLQLHGLLGAGPCPQTRTPPPQCPLLHLILCVLSLVGLSVSLPCALGLSIPFLSVELHYEVSGA